VPITRISRLYRGCPHLSPRRRHVIGKNGTEVRDMGSVTRMRRGRIAIEVNIIPAGFTRSLERRGLARRVLVTGDGLELEPVAPIDDIVEACRRAGMRVWGLTTPGGRLTGWERTARPARSVFQRLHDERSPVWLPTYPAA
jgi:hypothetical protein